jgi:hypothetical protein
VLADAEALADREALVVPRYERQEVSNFLSNPALFYPPNWTADVTAEETGLSADDQGHAASAGGPARQ